MNELEKYSVLQLQDEIDRRKQEILDKFVYYGHITQDDLFKLGFIKNYKTVVDHWNSSFEQDFAFIKRSLCLFRVNCYLMFEWAGGLVAIQSKDHLIQLLNALGVK